MVEVLFKILPSRLNQYFTDKSIYYSQILSNSYIINQLKIELILSSILWSFSKEEYLENDFAAF